MINTFNFYNRTVVGNKLIKLFVGYLTVLIILVLMYYSSFEHAYYTSDKYYGICVINEAKGKCPRITVKGTFNREYEFEGIYNCDIINYSRKFGCYNFKGLVVIESYLDRLNHYYFIFWISLISILEIYIIIQILFGLIITYETFNDY